MGLEYFYICYLCYSIYRIVQQGKGRNKKYPFRSEEGKVNFLLHPFGLERNGNISLQQYNDACNKKLLTSIL